MQERKINPFQQTRQDEKSQKNCMKVQTKGCKEEEKDCNDGHEGKNGAEAAREASQEPSFCLCSHRWFETR